MPRSEWLQETGVGVMNAVGHMRGVCMCLGPSPIGRHPANNIQ